MNGVRLEAERLGTEFLGGGALDPTIRETSDGGTPITVAEPDNPHALVFCRMGRTWDKSPGRALIAARRRAPSSE